MVWIASHDVAVRHRTKIHVWNIFQQIFEGISNHLRTFFFSKKGIWWFCCVPSVSHIVLRVACRFEGEAVACYMYIVVLKCILTTWHGVKAKGKAFQVACMQWMHFLHCSVWVVSSLPNTSPKSSGKNLKNPGSGKWPNAVFVRALTPKMMSHGLSLA